MKLEGDVDTKYKLFIQRESIATIGLGIGATQVLVFDVQEGIVGCGIETKSIHQGFLRHHASQGITHSADVHFDV